ncbi:uncharacterized protein [Watersipora subatra]|uniref:uncharacterized protein n=1 Tax=Watersipora subatra TaxID=2589382 RepID=UPI00355C8AE1
MSWLVIRRLKQPVSLDQQHLSSGERNAREASLVRESVRGMGRKNDDQPLSAYEDHFSTYNKKDVRGHGPVDREAKGSEHSITKPTKNYELLTKELVNIKQSVAALTEQLRQQTAELHDTKQRAEERTSFLQDKIEQQAQGTSFMVAAFA